MSDVVIVHSATGLLPPALAERRRVGPVEVPGGHHRFVAHPEAITDAVDRIAS